MPPLRPLNTSAKLTICFAVVWFAAAALAVWAGGLASTKTPLHSGTVADRSAIWLALGVLSVATLLLARWSHRAINLPVRAAARLARRMARGDLSTEYGTEGAERTGEAGALLVALQAANDQLGDMVATVRAGTDEVASSADRLASAGLHLATRSALQSAMLVDAAVVLRQVGDGAGDQRARARQAADTVASAAHWTANGGADIDEGKAALACSKASCARIGILSSVLATIASEASLLLERAASSDQTGMASPASVLLAKQASDMAHMAGAAAAEIGALAAASQGRADTALVRLARASHALQQVADGMDKLGPLTTGLADNADAHQSAVARLDASMRAISLSASEQASVVTDATATAAGMREQVDGMARAAGAFVLAPRHGRRPTRPHLVSDRAGNVLRLRPASATGLAAGKAPSGRRKGRLPR